MPSVILLTDALGVENEAVAFGLKKKINRATACFLCGRTLRKTHSHHWSLLPTHKRLTSRVDQPVSIWHASQNKIAAPKFRIHSYQSRKAKKPSEKIIKNILFFACVRVLYLQTKSSKRLCHVYAPLFSLLQDFQTADVAIATQIVCKVWAAKNNTMLTGWLTLAYVESSGSSSVTLYDQINITQTFLRLYIKKKGQ